MLLNIDELNVNYSSKTVPQIENQKTKECEVVIWRNNFSKNYPGASEKSKLNPITKRTGGPWRKIPSRLSSTLDDSTPPSLRRRESSSKNFFNG